MAMDKLTESQIVELKKVFFGFDVDGNGSISANELEAAMTASGKSPSKEEVEKEMAKADAASIILIKTGCAPANRKPKDLRRNVNTKIFSIS